MSARTKAREERTAARPRRAYWLLGSLAIVHLRGEETDGRFSLVEWLTRSGGMTPLHIHRDDSQTVYVLEGEVTFNLPGVTRVCGPGELVYTPAGTPQTERVTSAIPARMLDVNAPSGFDGFVEAAGDRADALALPPPSAEQPDFERLVALAAEHGIEVLAPPGAVP
jgi:mannose-6-phosphate isomerase-like protein (cupin superfamily)